MKTIVELSRRNCALLYISHLCHTFVSAIIKATADEHFVSQETRDLYLLQQVTCSCTLAIFIARDERFSVHAKKEKCKP